MARNTTTTKQTATAAAAQTAAGRKAPAASSKAPAASKGRKAPAVVEADEADEGEAEPVNQWALEKARAAVGGNNATRRYQALAVALASLAKPGTTVQVRFAQVNALTGSTRGEREGCDVAAQWRRGLRRLAECYGTTGLEALGIKGLTVDGDTGRIAIEG